MKKHRLNLLMTFALLAGMATTAFAQTAAKQEYVSQRIANAISSGKFYMKLSGMFSHENETDGNTSMMIEMEVAVRNGVAMMRMPKMQQVSLIANSCTYQLNEASKTYTPIPPQGVEPDFNFGKLSFQRQGVCKLNGVDYYFDRYRSYSGQTITFYYNSNKVAAIDLGLKEQGMGVMNLLAFDTRIPDNMYFCLSPEWKRGNMGMAGGIDQNAMMAEAMKNINPDDLPEGFDISALMKGGGIDMEAIKKQVLSEIDPKDLPEGMSIDQLMAMTGAGGNAGTLNHLKQMSSEMKTSKEAMEKMLHAQGLPEAQIKTMLSNMFPDDDMMKQAIGAMEQQEARTSAVNNAPEPPRCSTPWHDSSQSCQLAAGNNLGAITVSGSKPHSPYIYMTNLNAPAQDLARTYSKEVTDEGVWRAFNALVKETEGMSGEEAETYLVEQCGALPTLAEMKFVNGEVIERAVAICMLTPSALAYNNAGLLFFCNKDTKNALTYYQAAERCDKDNPTVLANIAECFLELGDRAAARRYAERAVSLAPDFGLAYQILTTLNLSEKRYGEAAETLFRSAETHFSEITAQQFYTLWLALESGQAMVCQGVDFYRLFHDVFSQKNLDLLVKATRNGYVKKEGIDTPANQVNMPWLIQNGNLHLTYTALDKRGKEVEEKLKQLQDRNVQIEEQHIEIPLMLAMGMRNAAQEAADLTQFVKNITGFNLDKHLPELPSTDLYEMASQQARGSYDGCYLLDACQYWCLRLWMTYYEAQHRYLEGGWYCEDKRFGRKSEAASEREAWEKTYEGVASDLLKSALKVLALEEAACQEAYNACLESANTEIDRLRCKADYLRCQIRCNAKYVRNFNQYVGKGMEPTKLFYEKYTKPLIEEYWLRMNAMAAYCESTVMQEYFLNEVSQYINGKWIAEIGVAVKLGMWVEQEWSNRVRALEKELDEVVEQIIYLDQPVIQVVEKSGGELKNYGEKERPNRGFGIPLPWGEIGYRHNGEQYGFFFDNEATGKSTFWGEDDRTEVLETYDCLASKPHPDDPKGYAETLGKWAAQDGTKKVVDAAAKGLGLGAVSALAPVNKSSSMRQRKVTTDSKGNVSSSEIAYTDKRSVGIDALNMTQTRQRIRTGNAVRTVNHTQFNFLGIISIYETR